MVFRVQAIAEVTNDLVVELLATAVPAPGAGELFDTTSKPLEADDPRRLAQLTAELGAQAVEKEQLEAFARVEGELAQVRFGDRMQTGCWRRGGVQGGIAFPDIDSEAAEDRGQRLGEFADGHLAFALFDFEVVEDGMSGVVHELWVEEALGVADELDGHLLGRARYDFAAGRFEEESVGMQLDHGASSRVFTACTKSVASWNRR